MKNVLLVFLGGGLGSSLRYVISKYLNTIESSITYGTFTVNMVGSLIIGVFMGMLLRNESPSNAMLLFLVTGFCGGFTTFSAFAIENYELLKSGDFTNFVLYAGGSLVLGIVAVFIGIWLSKFIA
ncbi:MAG: CrcB protein [Patiriisocius sp.]|jgi:CrcB protein